MPEKFLPGWTRGHHSSRETSQLLAKMEKRYKPLPLFLHRALPDLVQTLDRRGAQGDGLALTTSDHSGRRRLTGAWFDSGIERDADPVEIARVGVYRMQ